MLLERSEKGKKAKSLFFTQFNDIDIYVEDKSKGTRKLYREIFTRAMAGRYRIETVFPLGNKLTVLKQCEEDQQIGGRLRLYIVDADLDLLNGSNPKELKRLFVLNRYCIENYLVDEQAIVSVINEEDLEKQAPEIKSEFDFGYWVRSNEHELFELFVLYALAKKVCPEFPTVSYSVSKLVSSNHGIVDFAKVEERKNEVKKSLLEIVDSNLLRDQCRDALNMTCQHFGDKLRYISGKDYLLPLILMRMRWITKLRADNEVIKLRLSMRCDVSDLSMACNHIVIKNSQTPPAEPEA